MRRTHRLLTVVFVMLTFITGNLSAQPGSNPVVSPEVLKDRTVIFRLYAPEARTVKVTGTFMDPIPTVDMVRNDTGLFVANNLSSSFFIYF